MLVNFRVLFQTDRLYVVASGVAHVYLFINTLFRGFYKGIFNHLFLFIL